MKDLSPFFAPKSIAVVGAGERPSSSGGAVLRNLIRGGFKGRLIPVNPKGGEILGYPAFPSLSAIGPPVDLVVVVVRPDLIPGIVREAGETGSKNVLILPGGFKEAGPEGAARDAEVRRIAAEFGITIAGPNCAGIMHMAPDYPVAPSFLRNFPPGGGIAAISQSGAILEEMIAAAHDRHIRLSSTVSVGNAMHLGVTDYLDHLGEDANTTGIMLYIESVEDRERFVRVARRIAASKPIVALIGGGTPEGGAAAANHTGAAAMSDAEADAFCEEAGLIRVKSLRRLLVAAKGFGYYPKGMGRRILLLSNSGGPGVIATDRAVQQGLSLPALPQDMATGLTAELPPEAAVANPLDLLADAREARFGATFDHALPLAGSVFDAILMIHVVPFMVDAGPVISVLAEKARAASVPVLHSMMGTLEHKKDWFGHMQQAGVPMFNDVEEMAECGGLLAQYPAIQARLASSEENPLEEKILYIK